MKTTQPIETCDQPPWQWQLKHAISSPEQLLQQLQLTPEQVGLGQARRLFPLRVPKAFVEKMRKGDANDPLFRQIWPDDAEFEHVPGYQLDPLQEHDSPVPGVIHKYKSRLLLVVRGGCAVNCRYCFRRHFPYGDNKPTEHHWQPAIDYIEKHSELNEVILSGGDPLMANDQQLSQLLDQLEQIPHLKRLRIHTRLPVMIPERLTLGLKQRLQTSRLQTVLVLHINHPNEIDERLQSSLAPYKQAGIWLLNQSVLLAGVNNNAATLVALSEALFDAGVQPYYLHLLDPVAQTAHFDMPEAHAQQLVHSMLAQLPGFLVPKLVREIAGEASKTPLDLRMEK
ncbi:EF-P beta-lysylation protein EpmB [Neiella marina]|uniref:L-lysine 2,3-aminomutase n=1 Tax=Neiella holothuriorum TaxID=2870530 RepID=A0ABS7EJM1_9GAMM|nr:EF-P beta-lysylation protein EpmB [Neiella holothuriorum]MBW8192552.1 EF-P beta-lysylation protein EpmB [Neiella holothuriorum]